MNNFSTSPRGPITHINGGYSVDSDGVPFISAGGSWRRISPESRPYRTSRLLQTLLNQPASRMPLIARAARKLEGPKAWWASQACRQRFGDRFTAECIRQGLVYEMTG